MTSTTIPPPTRAPAVESESAGDDSSSASAEDQSNVIQVLFLGDSITAGLGVDPCSTFPALIQNRIDSLGYPAIAVNAGISGETTSGGLSRIQWMLRDRVDILFLELGGNDGLRGINLDLTASNLNRIIELTREAYPDVPVILAGMQIPPNLGHEYTRAFSEIYPDVAEKHDAILVPFAAGGLGELQALLQPDGIHPNEAGHRMLASEVWIHLEPMLTRSIAALQSEN